MADGAIQVLIVDDVAETRHNIRKLLEFEADICVVGEAADGREALALAKELQPDCVLMDINMPGLDGISATERIYQVAPDCLPIVISVQGEQEYLRKAMLAGARDYLVKPFSGQELVNTIRQVYSRTGQAQPAEGCPGQPQRPGDRGFQRQGRCRQDHHRHQPRRRSEQAAGKDPRRPGPAVRGCAAPSQSSS